LSSFPSRFSQVPFREMQPFNPGTLDPTLSRMLCQLSWKTLPGLRGLSCSDFRAIETAVPDTDRGVAVEFADAGERDALLAALEATFGPQRFSNSAAAFEAVKSYVLERVTQRGS